MCQFLLILWEKKKKKSVELRNGVCKAHRSFGTSHKDEQG